MGRNSEIITVKSTFPRCATCLDFIDRSTLYARMARNTYHKVNFYHVEHCPFPDYGVDKLSQMKGASKLDMAAKAGLESAISGAVSKAASKFEAALAARLTAKATKQASAQAKRDAPEQPADAAAGVDAPASKK